MIIILSNILQNNPTSVKYCDGGGVFCLVTCWWPRRKTLPWGGVHIHLKAFTFCLHNIWYHQWEHRLWLRSIRRALLIRFPVERLCIGRYHSEKRGRSLTRILYICSSAQFRVIWIILRHFFRTLFLFFFLQNIFGFAI